MPTYRPGSLFHPQLYISHHFLAPNFLSFDASLSHPIVVSFIILQIPNYPLMHAFLDHSIFIFRTTSRTTPNSISLSGFYLRSISDISYAVSLSPTLLASHMLLADHLFFSRATVQSDSRSGGSCFSARSLVPTPATRLRYNHVSDTSPRAPSYTGVNAVARTSSG